ncbi:MAG: PTS transporter subunit EIIC [Anaerostipes hadrus]|nr:PTS transporter subunit EIIC [Anaerostipes hadrus]
MAKNEKFKETATHVLEAVGGTQNISSVTHCITRLRFNLKDESVPNDEEVEKIPGVAGVMRTGGQYQVIIGQTVDKVYDALCEVGNLKNNDLDDELEGKEEGPRTLKSVGNKILNSLAGCLTPLIPMLIAGALFKTIVAVFGPDMLNILGAKSDLYQLFTFVGDAAFYFFPVVIGYTAAKQFKANPVIGMFLGGIMIHPSFTALVQSGAKFTVYGIPCSLQSYSATIFPIILSVWVMSYVERFFNKYVPSALKIVFAPFLTIVVMLPIALCVLGPAGAFLGNYICSAILALGNSGGIFTVLAIALIGAVWEFLVITGMHWLLITTITTVIASSGHEAVISAATAAASFAVGGMCLGVALRKKDKEGKALSFSYVISQVIGGVTEPGLYGDGFGYKKPFIGMIAGGFAGGLYGAITGLTAYAIVPVANFLCLLGYVGGSQMNFINGIISAVVSFVVAAVVTYIVGIDEE